MAEVAQIINEVTDKNGCNRRSLMPVLQSIVKEKGYLAPEDIVAVSRKLDIPAADVFGTASFYTFLDIVPRGRFIIRICKTTSCNMLKKDEVVDTLCQLLKIKVGETTADRKFTLLYANCLGWCHKGPVMLINDDVYTELNPKKAIEIMESYKTK